MRQILNGSKLLQINPVFKQVAQTHGFYSKKLEKQIAKTGSIQNISQIPTGTRRIFKSAYDISPQWHIRMQAAFQQHCDAAVSKTINFSEKATAASVDRAYKLAYQLNCKGITIYRRNSRESEPMCLTY
jgi:ribonucleoside-diphosphate reductase alpha chain